MDLSKLLTELSPAAMGLIAVVPLVVQRLKGLPIFANLEKKGYKANNLLSIALGIGGAFLMSVPNPIVAGVLVGLASSGAYDVAKKPKKPK